MSRGLAWRFFVRDLRSQHRRSALGYLWIVLPPLVTAAAWVFLDRVGVVNTATGEIPYGVFVVAGTTLWQGFLDGLNVPLAKLDLAQSLITKHKVPPEALVTTGILDVLFNQAIRLVLATLLTVAAGVVIGWQVLLVPFGAAALVLLGVQIGSVLAPVGTLYRDVPRAVQLVTTLWFFLTPIVYAEPDGAAEVSPLNPVGVLLVSTRSWLLDTPPGPTTALVLWSGAVLLMLPMVFAFYRLVTPHLVDRAVA